MTLTNTSDARFELLNRGGHNLYDQAGLVIVPPHASVTIGLAGETRTEFEFTFGVLNALTAPGAFPELRLAVSVPAEGRALSRRPPGCPTPSPSSCAPASARGA